MSDQCRADEIIIGHRYRQDLGNIVGLAGSIEELGLLHPIVVNAERELIAGRRRLAACMLLGWEKVPVRVVDLENILQGERQSHIIPDLDISKDDVRIWIEVKVKKSAIFTRMTQQNEHGISRRLYNDYLRVQQITGTEVWLYIIEEDTGDILRAPIDSLAKVRRIYDGERMDPGGMVFFPQATFEIWKTIGQLEARGNSK